MVTDVLWIKEWARNDLPQHYAVVLWMQIDKQHCPPWGLNIVFMIFIVEHAGDRLSVTKISDYNICPFNFGIKLWTQENVNRRMNWSASRLESLDFDTFAGARISQATAIGLLGYNFWSLDLKNNYFWITFNSILGWTWPRRWRWNWCDAWARECWGQGPFSQFRPAS